METTEASRLPEETIQHIQSFLSGKEAARTAILSKSWYTAWLTRPDLDFSECDFPIRCDFSECDFSECDFSGRSESVIEFLKMANKTVQRYAESNRTIHSFKLHLYGSSRDRPHPNELIASAMKLGVTDVDIELGRNLDFVLPDEVFRCPTLVRLSLAFCKIGFEDRNWMRFSGLKSLSLEEVVIESGDVVWDIVSMCPVLEELVLSGLECANDFSDYNSYRTLPMNDRFPTLKVLFLEEVEIGEWLFHDFASRFPSLEELTIDDCFGYGEEIQICSDSLERVSFTHWMEEEERIYRAKFDFSRIRKFKFLSSSVTSLSLKIVSREWESDITIWCEVDHPSTYSSFLVVIRDFLMEMMSRSKIYLSIDICMEKDDSTVEKLQINAPSLTHSAILRELFLELSSYHLNCRSIRFTLKTNEQQVEDEEFSSSRS